MPHLAVRRVARRIHSRDHNTAIQAAEARVRGRQSARVVTSVPPFSREPGEHPEPHFVREHEQARGARQRGRGAAAGHRLLHGGGRCAETCRRGRRAGAESIERERGQNLC